MNLIIKEINEENFSQYGQIISTKNTRGENINNNTSKSFFDLVDVDILGKDKSCRVNIFKAIKRIFPLEINMLENHPFSSQAFIPLEKTSFIIVVAPISNIPNLDLIEAFKVNNEEGVNFKPKIWHFPLISLKDCDFLTIDKKDFKNNLEVYDFKNNDKIFLNYE